MDKDKKFYNDQKFKYVESEDKDYYNMNILEENNDIKIK